MSTTFRNRIAIWALCSILPAAATLHADQLQMQNGDHYEGKVLSVTAESVVLQSDVLGKVTLPRNKVTQLIFGSGAATNSAAVVPHSPATTPAMQPATNIDLSGALSGLGADTNFIQQIRQQMLAGSGPQAGQKYDELVGGLMSGK